jgi:hypothetical protein
MSRRIFSISLVLGFLLLSSLLLMRSSAQAQVPTPTPMPTSPAEFAGAPLSGPAPLTVQFSHIGGNGPDIYCAWTFGDGTGQTFTAIAQGSNPFPACPPVSHAYTVGGKFTVALNALTGNGNFSASKVNFEYVQVAGPTATPTPSTPSVPELSVQALFYANSNPPCPNNPHIQVSIVNNGSAFTTPFQVTFNGETRTVNGLGLHQGFGVDFSATGGTKTAVVDATNVIAESSESNNSMTFILPALTPCGGPSLTPTRTPTTAGPTATRTRTPTSGPTATRTPTPVAGSACSPVNATITAPFIFDGAGTFCWQSSNLGTFINSWNTTSVALNGVNVTNVYVASGSYPAKINGFWYVRYSSSVAWGHFETK